MRGGALCGRRYSQQGEGCEEEIRRRVARKILRFLTGVLSAKAAPSDKHKPRRRGAGVLHFWHFRRSMIFPGSCSSENFAVRGPADYSCPYLWSTARQSLETRQLWAASVAPQRARLLHDMPAERSHNLAAAGLHGASSARSIALAAVAVRPIKKQAANIVFMLGSIPHVCWEAACLLADRQKIQHFVRRTTSHKILILLT